MTAIGRKGQRIRQGAHFQHIQPSAVGIEQGNRSIVGAHIGLHGHGDNAVFHRHTIGVGTDIRDIDGKQQGRIGRIVHVQHVHLAAGGIDHEGATALWIIGHDLGCTAGIFSTLILAEHRQLYRAMTRLIICSIGR